MKKFISISPLRLDGNVPVCNGLCRACPQRRHGGHVASWCVQSYSAWWNRNFVYVNLQWYNADLVLS